MRSCVVISHPVARPDPAVAQAQAVRVVHQVAQAQVAHPVRAEVPVAVVQAAHQAVQVRVAHQDQVGAVVRVPAALQAVQAQVDHQEARGQVVHQDLAVVVVQAQAVLPAVRDRAAQAPAVAQAAADLAVQGLAAPPVVLGQDQAVGITTHVAALVISFGPAVIGIRLR